MYRRMGIKIGANASISANVRITGNVKIGKFSSIAQNCSISGTRAGVILGDYVMIAPNCVFVAFDHGFLKRDIPMQQQVYIEEEIIVRNDVWIGANCVITKGSVINEGAVIAANSVVKGVIEPFGIYGGSPAKLIKYRP